ncbi:MAG: 8-oxo-dGTP diphosphatase MutT [Gammaproteobacteria bacterium]|jgi:8-oxo-dGTP diphosphatase
MNAAIQTSRELHVAAGVLQDASGRVLVSRRSGVSLMPGALEFPGGKIAPGETPLQGLVRELEEEIGIEVRYARHFLRLVHQYPEFRVRLYVWRVLLWNGTPRGMEGQELHWMSPTELLPAGLLPADAPVVDHLQKQIPVNDLHVPGIKSGALAVA